MKKVFLLLAIFSLQAIHVSAEKVKTSYRNALVFAYSQANSVYEDDNIRLEIYDEQLWATNKTSKTIFIDLAQCFVFHNGASMPLFDDSKKTMGDKKASKKGVSTKDDFFLTIAPSMGDDPTPTFICLVTTRMYGKYTTSETPSNDFTEYDKRMFGLIEEILEESKSADPKGKEYKGTVVRHFIEDESINNIGASIAYAFNKKAEEWTNVAISTWVSDVIFAPYYVELPKELSKKEKRGFGVKETDPAFIHVKSNSPFEFEADKAPLIVFDWEGNYKKGTFELGYTWVFKKKKPSALAIIGAVFTYGTTLLTSLKVTAYKKMIMFDGVDDDWGKLTYVSSMMDTEQSK